MLSSTTDRSVRISSGSGRCIHRNLTDRYPLGRRHCNTEPKYPWALWWIEHFQYPKKNIKFWGAGHIPWFYCLSSWFQHRPTSITENTSMKLYKMNKRHQAGQVIKKSATVCSGSITDAATRLNSPLLWDDIQKNGLQ
jgi:hypothetical protein